jgi:hypothetical protein
MCSVPAGGLHLPHRTNPFSDSISRSIESGSLRLLSTLLPASAQSGVYFRLLVYSEGRILRGSEVLVCFCRPVTPTGIMLLSFADVKTGF